VKTVFRNNPFRNVALFTAFLLLLVFTLTCLAELRSIDWDWDIDHRMYFGTRLLHGELIWTREYDDKLPTMQFLFLLPALARSVRAWQLMSIGLIISAASGLYLWLNHVLQRDWELKALQTKLIGFLTASLYLYLIAVLPGSISHHNSAAASIFTLGLIAAVPVQPSSLGLPTSREPGRARFWLAALLMAAAISLRPYYLLPALLAAPWKTLRVHLWVGRPLRSKILARTMLWQCGSWAAAIALVGLVLNALPYVLSGNFDAFRNGLIMLSQETVPFQLGSMITIQLQSILGARFLAFFAFSLPPVLCLGVLIQISHRRRTSPLPLHWSRTQVTDILLVCLLMPASLEWTILEKHYFPHYQQLFSPLIALAFAFFLASLAISLRLNPILLTPQQSTVFGILCTLILLATFRIGLTAPLPALFHPPLESRLASYVLLRPEGKQNILGKSFLAPSSMFLHWKLDQSRHGFPHAALTGFIEGGFWKEATIPPSLGFPFPTNASAYCEQLINQGPQQVIDSSGSPSIRCLQTDAKATYVKSQEFKLLTADPDLHLYVRRGSSPPESRSPR
jgi:hypothetical protein